MVHGILAQRMARMAFTNYLMQGPLIVPICLLFGWFDKVRRTALEARGRGNLQWIPGTRGYIHI